jgi:hypothetical protein
VGGGTKGKDYIVLRSTEYRIWEGSARYGKKIYGDVPPVEISGFLKSNIKGSFVIATLQGTSWNLEPKIDEKNDRTCLSKRYPISPTRAVYTFQRGHMRHMS